MLIGTYDVQANAMCDHAFLQPYRTAATTKNAMLNIFIMNCECRSMQCTAHRITASRADALRNTYAGQSG